MKQSSYSGFFKLSPEERLREVTEFCNLTSEEQEILKDPNCLDMDKADHMIENVIGRFALPLGVGLNFKINEKDYLIPMVSEEPSVVAAASNAAKIIRESGGFTTSNTGSVMIAQIQITDVADPHFAKIVIEENKEKIKTLCNEKDPILVKFGGGMEDLEVRIIESIIGKMVIVHLKVNTLDAMGANAVNTMAEAVSPLLEELTGGRAFLRILSNLAIHRLARARVKIKKETIGEDIVDKIITAYAFAEADPFRAVTHNKGIMNGIIPVVLATGNDTRAIESGAHAYASITGRYTSLTTWEKDKNGDLVGTIELPMAVGLVGGATKIHPTARVAVKMLGVKSAAELGEIIASVGLANNFAAIKALATEGIQRGHMSLHARNLATVAGAKGEALESIVVQMIKEKNVRLEYAQELLKKFNSK
ncbi:hydroxymethylglutaryl-CoA reductase, degradative [Fusobacterium ulcerans]|jgi:hydroxymethylglutaryl-CoA reductase|uniref:3-hydroxy-3-methylglutaryl coenzyme A reductase n=1 Tax=Fusobacterium ulcerans TaxID=861 RepID=A0AAX1TU83_9FUSO|nr:hydroxymethylglutaryl-CoA reductase, degradative [Fusobacterium ulcerans]AVQ27950.1 hydroxymethylglutaryl-CoA reductase, degradative [Fusobacterium ulcerans]EFS25407.1 hydroxymethylglutaryl-CoA reductase, degradative [Fusobacterium ulcerans ATCC 49185]RGY66482.1 hydroxymethylglutaryl-CoA reductase, degradative [Fusobacterium ulcerans]SQI99369.1 3-hydroxy-3-methylglutaryl-coenzyme A reductase [Fusobacterium ulcerans]HJH07366.1 hydroxymethylglutaryl-CoA reductase, degradative [Fusobacterium u